MKPTPEQRQYAEQWMKSRGAEPVHAPPWGWMWSLECYPYQKSTLPHAFDSAMHYATRGNNTRDEAIDALAIALAKMMDACKIPACEAI